MKYFLTAPFLTLFLPALVFASAPETCRGRLPSLEEIRASVICEGTDTSDLAKLQVLFARKLAARGYELMADAEPFVLAGSHSVTIEVSEFPDPNNAALLAPTVFEGKVFRGAGEVRSASGQTLSVGSAKEYEWPDTFSDAEDEARFAKARCLRAVKRAIAHLPRCSN